MLQRARCAPRMSTAQSERVLDLWCCGTTYKTIMDTMGLSKGQVERILRAARKRGDAKAVRRYKTEPGLIPFSTLTIRGPLVHTALKREAKKRGWSMTTLVHKLVIAIETDNIWTAVLDDEEDILT